MSEDNVVELKSRIKRDEDTDPRDVIWQCQCGTQTFYLLETGEVQCSLCKGIPKEIACFEPDGPTPSPKE